MKIMFLLIMFACIFQVSCSAPPEQGRSDREVVPVDETPILNRPVPAYELDAFHNDEITRVNLARYRGKWLILFFYPGDFTFVCPTELKELADYYPEFKKFGAEVLSISTDSVYAHRAWRGQSKSLAQVSYPMLSDRNGRLSRRLGVYDHRTGAALRASFVVNPEGVIVACEIHSDAIGRSADELLRKLSAAAAVRREAGGYCPAGWKQGDVLIRSR